MSFSPASGFGFCAGCGAPRTGAAAGFCANCGTDLAALEVAPPAFVPPPPPAYTPPPAWAGAVPPSAYDQPAANGLPPTGYVPVYEAAPARKGISPAILIGGLVVVILVAVGAFFFLNNANSGNGISFSPATINCATPVAWTSTLKLPSSVKPGDVLTVKLDGKSGTTMTMGEDSTIVQQSDGSWTSTSTVSAADVATACAAGGMTSEGIDVLANGTHNMQVVDASGKVVASGSYTVTGAGAAPSGAIQSTKVIPTQAPTQTPTAVPQTGSVTFNPSSVSCDHPVAFSTILTLPASVGKSDAITETFDGQAAGSFTVAGDGTFKQAADGSWTTTWPDTAAHMTTICTNGGVDPQGGLSIFTPGNHTFIFYNAGGDTLAQGTYTVLKPTATTPPTSAPTPTHTPTHAPTPTPAPVYSGQVLFSTVNPSTYSECAPASPVTSVSAKSPIYVTFIFGSRAGSEKFTYIITKNGAAFNSGPMTDTSGTDCVGETNDLSKLTGWGPGLYEFTEYRDNVIIGVGDLTVK